MNAVGCSHPGHVRELNEDSYRIDLDRGLVVVADGLGGHPYGEIASALAVQAVQRFFSNSISEFHRFPDLMLHEAVFFAHATLKDAVCEDPKLNGMGTTLLIAWIPPGSSTLRLSHIGDSRAYLLRGGELKQLTEDHNLLMEAMKAGTSLSWTEADMSSAHVLVQAVGQGDMLKPSNLKMTLSRDDRLLLCTDGLTDELALEDIQTILSGAGSLDAACRDLMQAALHNGASDNVTIAVVGES